VFALDARHLRYGSFHRGPQGWVFESYRMVELPPGTFGEGLLGAPLREPKAFNELVAGFAAQEPAIEEASLVLPDAWLRLTFTELAELPSKAEQREAMLRFKLKRLVPFRVEDLRVAATPVAALPQQEEPIRLLIGFGIELLLGQIEDAFAAAGVRIGQITNATLAALTALESAVRPSEMMALVLVEDGFYTLSFARAGEPLLYRYKALGEVPAHDRPPVVRRDLRLTRRFVAEQIPDAPLARLFLSAPPEQETDWQSWLYEELDAVPEVLSLELVPLARGRSDLPMGETATLLGAACYEVR